MYNIDKYTKKYIKEGDFYMTNFERMKENLISQIKSLNLEQLETIIDAIDNNLHTFPCKVFDKKGLFTCSACRHVYGECSTHGNPEECSERFKRYALSENKN